MFSGALPKVAHTRLANFLICKGDKALIRNIHKHIQTCWGKDVLKTICEAKNLTMAQNKITSNTENGSIMAVFE
jgi:hypothetical protein